MAPLLVLVVAPLSPVAVPVPAPVPGIVPVGLPEPPEAPPEAPAEAPDGEAEVVPEALALAWKARKVLSGVGLRANTIPEGQWEVCLQ